MMTTIYDYSFDNIDKISNIILSDGVGIIPCDTIYGFCARVNDVTREKIYEIKNRPKNKNLIVLSTLEELDKLSLEVPSFLYNHWPCALTAILKEKSSDKTVAIRVPGDEYIYEILKRTGAMFSTSVNLSGEPFLNDFASIYNTFNAKVDFIVKKEMKEDALASTLIDCTTGDIKVIREGSYRI